MIVWVNGAFGVGKTQVAHELRRCLGRGWIADPELPGFGLHRMLPPHLRGDFQDVPGWRVGVRDVLGRLDADDATQPVIVPMTLVRDDYADEIVEALRIGGHDLRHVTLVATPETIRRRLASRGGAVRDLWAQRQIDRCVTALTAPRFARHVATDGRTIDEVVEDVAAGLDLPLAHGRDGRVRGFVRRRAVQLRHVRLP
ncbi:AAA family ATPase [Pseudonocardia dioxanivorans]|uniref:AAA family ATPase n=1 Tax=Pseudonocardia dioxanivorans TaxID=240495 RepID=UPI000CCFE94C|nr:AAA family ATPase [Pseudonocardia dioxanivorans]